METFKLKFSCFYLVALVTSWLIKKGPHEIKCRSLIGGAYLFSGPPLSRAALAAAYAVAGKAL